MARLDRLSPVKETAQIGACIGRVFHHRLLAAVSGYGPGAARRCAPAAEAGRAGIPQRRAAGGDLHVQARAGARHRLSEPAEEPAPADSWKDRGRAGSRVRRHRRDRAGDGGAALHARRAGCAGRAVVAEGRAAGDDKVCQPRGRGSFRQRARAGCIPARFRDASEAGAFAADCNGLGADPRQRLGRSGGSACVFDCAGTCRTTW